MCIEHRTGTWDVKVVTESPNGRHVCYAYVQGGCGLEACTSCTGTSCTWTVYDGKVWHDQPSVVMVTEAEAFEAVSSPSPA